MDIYRRFAGSVGFAVTVAMPLVPVRPRTRVEELLRSRGLSQSEVARLAGWGQSYLNRIIVGKTQLTLNSRRILARILRYPDSVFYEPLGAPIPAEPELPILTAPGSERRLAALVALMGADAAGLLRYLLAGDFSGLPPKLAARLRQILNGLD